MSMSLLFLMILIFILLAFFIIYIIYESKKSPVRNLNLILSAFKEVLKQKDNFEKLDEKYLKKLESILRYQELGKPRISFEPNYAKFTFFWNISPTIDAMYASLEILRILEKDDYFTFDKTSKYLDYIAECYVDGEAYAINTSKDFSSIYATNCAIGILKHLEGIPCENHFIKENIDLLPDQDKKIECFIRFVKSCKDPNSFLMTDNKKSGSEYHFINLYTAHRIFWNLNKSDIFYTEILNKENLFRSIIANFEKCRFLGFPLSHISNIGCICATRFALSLLKQINAFDHINNKQRENIIEYVKQCYDEYGGGFSSSYGDSPSLHSTFSALEIFKYFKYDFDKKENILNFVMTCKTASGFAFHKDFNPNPFASRYALQILSNLGEEGKKLIEATRNDIVIFLEKLNDKSEGSYWGFKPPSKDSNF